eukprot:7293567-Prymnesium_polylepis.1
MSRPLTVQLAYGPKSRRRTGKLILHRHRHGTVSGPLRACTFIQPQRASLNGPRFGASAVRSPESVPPSRARPGATANAQPAKA